MPVPTKEPDVYPTTEALTAEYSSGQRVWVYRSGSWRPGIVLCSSAKAVTVRYRPAEGPGTGVDTVTQTSIQLRADVDECLDVEERAGAR
jgi:hypothetical protein